MNNLNALSLQTLENQLNTFDKMKFIDDDGKEKISGRELSKALGYTDWRNFKKAVGRANEQISNSNKNDVCLIGEVTTQIKVNVGAGRDGKDRFQNRNVTDYHLTRKQAINVANNADTSKPEVAMVQEWLYETSETGERAAKVLSKLKDRQYIEDRSSLSLANKQLSKTCLLHSVESEELGIVHDACDKGMYDMSTEEVKERFGKSNRPKADFLGSTMCAAEAYARGLTNLSIESCNLQGVNQCSDAAFSVSREIREQIQRRSGQNPENLITGEDIKKVERRYKKLTKEQLAAIEKEY